MAEAQCLTAGTVETDIDGNCETCGAPAGAVCRFNPMRCRHEIDGEDYGSCRHCGEMFFRTSGGLWQSYEDGRRTL